VGVIDAIAEGCFAVARRPFVLLPLVLLDLLYWLGARVSIDEEIGRPWGNGVVDLGSGWLTLLAGFGLVIVGLLWFALTLAVVATLARNDSPTPRELVRRVFRCWVRLILLGLILIAVVIFLGLPLLVLAGMLQLLGLSPGGPLLLIAIPLLLAWLFLARTTDAIAVSDAGPFRAIKLSVTVVRRNFWAMFRLFAAGTLISFGFPLAWAFVARQTAGVPLAVVGNAFLQTGMLAAVMIFYRERLAALDQPAAAAGQPRPAPPPTDRRDQR
jgi:hypothetical protein